MTAETLVKEKRSKRLLFAYRGRIRILLACVVAVGLLFLFLAMPHIDGPPPQWQVDFLSISSCIDPSRDWVEQKMVSEKGSPITEMKAPIRADQYCSTLIRGGKILKSGAIEIDARMAEKGQPSSHGKSFDSYLRTDVQFVFYPSLKDKGSVEWTRSCTPRGVYSKIICNHE